MTQLISGALAGIDYFISKKQIRKFENEYLRPLFLKARTRLHALAVWFANIPITVLNLIEKLFIKLLDHPFLITWYIIVIVLHIPIWLLIGLLFCLFALAAFLFVACITAVCLSMELTIRFLLFCPKGVIAGCGFPIFVATTAYEIYHFSIAPR